MITLVLDTTSKYLVVGLIKDEVIDKIQYEAWQRQSEFAIQEVTKILERNNVNPTSVDRIVVSNGPGSYTGIRIALTIAKVYTIASPNTKIITLSSLESMVNIDECNIAVLDAKANRYYVGVYDHGKKVIDDCIMTKDELVAYISTHPNYKVVGETEKLGIEENMIDLVSNMYALSLDKEEVKDVDSLVPIYLKEAF